MSFGPKGLALLCAAALAVAGCGSSTNSTSSGSPEITVANQWVRATQSTTDPSMTTVYAEFSNHTSSDLTVVSASTALSDRTELHQMTMTGDVMVMGPLVGGIKIPANSSTSLDPNGMHIMLMNLKTPIAPGAEVTVSAKLSDGTSLSFDAMAKAYAGGNESYPGAMPSMSGMSTGPAAAMTSSADG